MLNLTNSILNKSVSWFPRFKLPVGLVRASIADTSKMAIDDNSHNESVDIDLVAVNESSLSSNITSLAPAPIAPIIPIAEDVPLEPVLLDEHIIPSVLEVESLKITKPFSLLLIQKGSYLVVDSLSSAEDPNVSAIESLGMAVLSYLETSQDPVTKLVFSWPMSGHQYAPRDAVSAHRVINNLLLDIDQESHIKEILLCGDVSQKYVLMNLDAGSYKLNAHNIQVVQTPRLSSLMYSPSMKSEFWRSYLDVS